MAAEVVLKLIGVDDASGVIGGVGDALGGLGNLMQGALNVGIGAAVAGFTALAGGIALSVHEAMGAQEVEAQLDAVLRSTGAAAEEQAQAWEDAQGKYVTSTRASQAQIADWQDQLVHAQARLTDMQNRLKDKEPTEVQKLQLAELAETVGTLQAKIASGGDTIRTSLVDALGLVAPVVRPTKDALLDLADGLSTVTRYSDDTIIGVESMLLTFTQIGADVFPQATEAVLDVAQAMGGDTKGAAVQLGKALNDPIAGISALTRVGVTFSEEQKKVIAKLVETGDIAGAQTVILDELAKEFGGSARAAGETFAGQLDILNNKLSNVAEGLGKQFLPILTDGVQYISTNVVPIIEDLANVFGWFLSDVTAGSPAFDGLYESLAAVFGPETTQSILDFLESFLNGFSNLVLFVQANMPILQAAIESAFNAIAPALNTVWNVIQTQLIPAFENLFVALFGPIPTAQQAFDGLIAAIGVGATMAADFLSNTLAPAITSLANWINTTLIPNLQNLQTWLNTNLPIAIQFLTDAWNNVIYPALVTIDAWVTGTLIPTLTTLWDWINANLPAAIQILTDFFNNTLMPALTALWNFISVNIVPLLTSLAGVTLELLRLAFEALVTYYNSTFQPMLQALSDFVNNTIIPALTTFTTWLGSVTGGVEGISRAIQSAISWLDDLAEALANIHIPPNLTPGSPTPFEMGLRGISSATKTLRGDLRGLGADMAKLNGGPEGGPSLVGPGGGTGARPGGFNGGALSGDPVVVELRRAVALLEKIAVELEGDNRVSSEMSAALA